MYHLPFHGCRSHLQHHPPERESPSRHRHKSFYADLAYRYRAQSADFYAFDDSWGGTTGLLQKQKVSLDRHGFNVTLGYRF